ncbi:MAG: TadE family protein [Methylococcales bacterium]
MNSFLKEQQGASILEFLVVIPVLVTLAFTVIEFGGVYIRYNTVTKTVQDAARYLTANSDADQSIAENLIRYNSINAEGGQLLPGNAFSVDIDRNVPVVGSGRHVRVTATYNHTPVAGNALSNLVQLIGGQPLDLNMALTASSVMRVIE